MEADWPLIAVRFALYATLSGLFGLSAFSLYGLRAGERGASVALRSWLAGSGLLGLLLSSIDIALLAASMAGVPAWPVDGEAIGMLLTGSATGTAWKVRIGALVIASIIALIAAGRAVLLGLVALMGATALATLAWTGHGAMDDGVIGWAHLLADIVHLLAAGAWIGALLGLTLLVARRADRLDATHLRLTHRALHGFGLVGSVVVGAIVVTGLLNSWLLVGIGNLSRLPQTLYGQLLLAKLILFGAMLGIASLNRFRLTPALEEAIARSDHGKAIGILRRSLALEAGCAITILALVAWLGMLEPPTSAM